MSEVEEPKVEEPKPVSLETIRGLWYENKIPEVVLKVPAAAALMSKKRITFKSNNVGKWLRVMKQQVPLQWACPRRPDPAVDKIEIPYDEACALINAAREYCRKVLGDYLAAAVELQDPQTKLVIYPMRFFHMTSFVRLPFSPAGPDDGLDRYYARILFVCGVLMCDEK
jgi:hypothetical protein